MIDEHKVFQCPPRAFLISTQVLEAWDTRNYVPFQCPSRAFLISTGNNHIMFILDNLVVSMPSTGFSYFYKNKPLEQYYREMFQCPPRTFRISTLR